MQNWNDGKRQEFADRKTYKIGELDSKAQKYGEDSHSISGKTYELYTTATCPQCRMIKPVLEAARIPYVLRDVEQYKIEAVSLGLRQAPSLVVSMENGDKEIYAGYAQIKAYIDGRNAVV